MAGPSQEKDLLTWVCDLSRLCFAGVAACVALVATSVWSLIQFALSDPSDEHRG